MPFVVKRRCGKAVNLLLSVRIIFAKFSLAPNVAFRQNPARVFNLIASEPKEFDHRVAGRVPLSRTC